MSHLSQISQKERMLFNQWFKLHPSNETYYFLIGWRVSSVSVYKVVMWNLRQKLMYHNIWKYVAWPPPHAMPLHTGAPQYIMVTWGNHIIGKNVWYYKYTNNQINSSNFLDKLDTSAQVHLLQFSRNKFGIISLNIIVFKSTILRLRWVG